MASDATECRSRIMTPLVDNNVATYVEKPWGREEIWAKTDKYVGKRLFVNADCRLSRQMHVKKTETFMLMSGHVIVEVGAADDMMFKVLSQPGAFFHCPAGTIHRICALTDSVLVEVSTPELDDIVRFEDDYARETK